VWHAVTRPQPRVGMDAAIRVEEVEERCCTSLMEIDCSSHRFNNQTM
jgi:hypothetical protein